MTSESSPHLSDHPFWLAVARGDVRQAETLLREDASLCNRDFRPIEDQDPHTFGFPLVKAVDTGNVPMVQLLIAHGADVDAKSPTEEQRELGAPLMHAFERGAFELANLLLDHGASWQAYGWCYPALVELAYEAACRDGAPSDMARGGLDEYLGPSAPRCVPDDAPETVKLFDRLLDLGAVPSMESLVRQQYNDAIGELLQTCPDAPCAIHDCPKGTVLQTLCQAASWWGYPDTLKRAMRLCPDRYSAVQAVDAITRALVSHNREGLASDYYRLVESQLQFLREQNELETIIQSGQIAPHSLLAANYLWPGWCGNEKDPSTPESMIELSELFRRYGFDDVTAVDRESGKTALQHARTRSDQEGIDQFIDYLVQAENQS